MASVLHPFFYAIVNQFEPNFCSFIAGQKLSSVGFSPRFLGAVWCLATVVFASAYVGILMSFLRFPKLSPVITKLEQLPASHLKWAVLRGTALDHLFTVRIGLKIKF